MKYLLTVSAIIACLFLSSCLFFPGSADCTQPRLYAGFDSLQTSLIINKYSKDSDFRTLIACDTLDTLTYMDNSYYRGYSYQIDADHDWQITLPSGNTEYKIQDIRFEEMEGGPDREEGCSQPVFYTLNGNPKKLGSITNQSSIEAPPSVIRLNP